MVSAASFYFTSSAEKEGSASVYKGFNYAYMKHPGSLAFGSLMHLVIFIIRVIIEVITDAAHKDGGN